MSKTGIMAVNRFRLYPSKTQESFLSKTLEVCRQTYNVLLGELNTQNEIDKSQIQATIPNMKICDPFFKEAYSKTVQYECYRLFSNLAALVETKQRGHKVGRLRFKGKNWFKTFTYNQSGFKLIDTGKRCQTLQLSKIGDIPIRCHRNLKGKIKQITIKHESSGKWFASIVTELKVTIPKVPIKKIVGIDLGLTDIAYDSDNHKTGNPHNLKTHAKRIAHLQRKLSKKQKQSNNRKKARLRLAKQYEKLRNSRDDFVHKLSRYYVNNYDVIGFEDLIIPNMTRGNFAKSILDASWGKLRQFTFYKAESAGKMYVSVNSRGTTQRCSQCGKIVRKELWDRIHCCPGCGFKTPRDYNSALEIKRLTLLEIGQELSESTLVEMEALPFEVTSVSETRSPTLISFGN